MNYVPQESNDAELLADRIIPRLQHTNSAIILAACRVILYLTNYIADDAVVNTFYKKVGAPLGKENEGEWRGGRTYHPFNLTSPFPFFLKKSHTLVKRT